MSKLYLRNTDTYTTYVATEKSTAWSATNSLNLRRDLSVTAGTSQASNNTVSTSGTAAHRIYYGKWISAPLTVSSVDANTWTFAVGISEGNAQANQSIGLSIYVLTSGDTVRGFVYDQTTALGTEISATEGGKVVTVSGSQVTGVVSTDRIAVEWWSTGTPGMTGPYVQTIYWDGTTDPSEGVATNDHASYISTPQDLFAGPTEQADPETALVTGTSNAPGLAVQTATTYDKVVVGDTPVSFWNDDSGTDAIGLSNLTKFNSPTSTQAPDGTNCMVFNGTNQYAEGTDQNAYSIPTTGRLTFEAWIRPDVLEFPVDESTGYVNWAGKTGSGASNDAEWLTRMYSKTTTDVPPRPHRVSGYAYNPDGGLGTGGYFEDPLALGEWIHVVFVVNKADAGGSYPDGYGILYKNGVLRRQENLDVGGTAINPGNGTAPFRIGSARAQSSFFKGAIAKPAIYSYELSAAQVLEHYNAMKLSLALSQDAAALVGVSALVASGSASANNATITTTGGGEAPAQNALVAVTVETSSRLVSASPRTA